MAAAVLLALPTQAAEVTDDYGVITSPADGTHKYYTRSGSYLSGDNGKAQSGKVETVWCEDGTVYIKDIISQYAKGTWVKGTVSGNTLTVATDQVVYGYYDDWMEEDILYKLAWGKHTYNEDWDWYSKSKNSDRESITFSVSGDVITLNESNAVDGETAGNFIGIFKSSSYQQGDYATVWTLDADYEPASTDLVEVPSDLTTTTWYATYTSGSTPVKRSVLVGFADETVYIQSLFSDFPEAWVKGTVSGTTATFKAMQYLGQKSNKDCWFTGEGLEDLVMTYDADKQKLTATGSVIATNSEDKVSAVATYSDVVLFAEDEKIDELPYSNALTSGSDFLQFSVIDANSDNSTWSYSNGVRYRYNDYNDGDDWLISPAIKLEAGKMYHFAIDAKNYGDTEKMEVKLASAATAEALSAGTSIIASTNITSSSYTTYENETVSVNADGYYYFGIHAISDAYSYFLYVANFLVEAGAESTSPAAVSDLTVVQAEGELAVSISFTAPTKDLNGDDLTANLTKIEILRDGSVIKTFTDVAKGAELSYKDDDENLTYGSHTYQVLPYNATGAGQKSETEVFVQGIPVTVPAGLTTATWNVKYNTNVKTTATVGFDGNDVYIQGLFTNFPEAWIVGTISDGTATFESGQFLGVRNGDLIWMTSSDDDDFADFVMTYDADARVFTAQNKLIANYGLDEIYSLATLKDLVIQEGEFEEAGATTAANVDELPYTNALNTQTLFADFGVLDVKEDGYTWKWSSQNSAPYYNYEYFADEAADDWFVSPAIKLVAGKKYHFAIDARKSGSDTQKIEVKIATKATASKLAAGTSVIASTNLTTTYSTYENEELTVSETGYYHFGIHAFTDANSSIYVQNFLVEEIITGAPATVTDLAVAQAGDEPEATVTFTAPTQNVGGEDLTGNLTKIELLRDDEVVKTFTDVAPGAELEYVDATTVGKHVYAVIAYNAAGAGKKSAEVSITIIGVASVPYTADLTNQDTFDLFTVIDNNSDGYTWKWYNTSKGARYSYSEEDDADDYLITLPISLEAGKNYKVTVAAANSYAGWYTENMEVLVGKTATAAGLTQTVIEDTEVDDDEFTDFTGTFTVSESGNYYVAIHCTSEADQSSLYVKTLAIEEAAPTTIAVGIEHAGYATFSSTYALDFSEVTAIKAYTAAVDNEGNITFNEIQKVPANTGVLLVNPEAKESVTAISVPVIDNDDADEVENNALVAVSTAIASLPSVDGNVKNYILNSGSQGVGFYRAAGQSVAAGKAYLRLSVAEGRSFIGFNFDGTTTGISQISNPKSQLSNLYDLQGRKVSTGSQLKKGLYIINNKKVSVK